MPLGQGFGNCFFDPFLKHTFPLGSWLDCFLNWYTYIHSTVGTISSLRLNVLSSVSLALAEEAILVVEIVNYKLENGGQKIQLGISQRTQTSCIWLMAPSPLHLPKEMSFRPFIP